MAQRSVRRSAAVLRAVFVDPLVAFGGCCPRNLLELGLIFDAGMVVRGVDRLVIPRNSSGIVRHETPFLFADSFKWHFLFVRLASCALLQKLQFRMRGVIPARIARRGFFRASL